MTQTERRLYLISELLKEQPGYAGLEIPEDEDGQNQIRSIAFCRISTGEFDFPNEKAAEIAIQTVNENKERTDSKIEVIFNVFKETDLNIYRKLLGAN